MEISGCHIQANKVKILREKGSEHLELETNHNSFNQAEVDLRVTTWVQEMKIMQEHSLKE